MPCHHCIHTYIYIYHTIVCGKLYTQTQISHREWECAHDVLCVYVQLLLLFAECVCAPITIVSVTFSKSWGFMAAKSKQTDWGN